MSDTEIQNELLPLGSIVKIGDVDRKLMIVGRGYIVDTGDGGKEFFDYGMAVYPFGLIGDALVYTNREEISEIVFRGYADEEDAEMRDSIAMVFDKVEISKIVSEGMKLEDDSW